MIRLTCTLTVSSEIPSHPGLRELLPDRGDGADSAHIRKSEVHERDIRPVLPELLKSRLGRTGCPDQFQIAFIRYHRRDPLAEKRMVVDTKNADWYRGTHDLLSRE